MWTFSYRVGDEIEVLPQCAELMFVPKSRRMTVSDGEMYVVETWSVLRLYLAADE